MATIRESSSLDLMKVILSGAEEWSTRQTDHQRARTMPSAIGTKDQDLLLELIGVGRTLTFPQLNDWALTFCSLALERIVCIVTIPRRPTIGAI